MRNSLIAARNGLVACVACAVLAACAGQPTGPAPAPPGSHADRSMASPPGDTAPSPAATPAVPPPAPKLAAIDPARLVGMTGTRISSLFGTPVFVRRDPPGEFWRYRGESCVLELFFYLRDGAQRVDHIETRAGSGAPLDQADCIASLRKRPAKG